MSESWRPAASRTALFLRARVLRDIRAFFDQRGVLEVETPLLSRACATDPNLSSFTTRYQQAELFLNTSPEFCMKRLVAAHGEAVFQICKAFRADELGPVHNPEFTILEWYRPGYDMFALMDEVAELVHTLASAHELDHDRIQKISYADAFREAAGLDPHTASADECRLCAVRHGVEQPVGLGDAVDEWLDWLLTQLVMPSFQTGGFTFLYDYPRSQAALAELRRDRDGNTVAARFELFYGEMELANGFDELRDAAEQRARFDHDNRLRNLTGLMPSTIDEYLLQALAQGLPACGGVALGLDRLLMVLDRASSIEQVLAFPFSRI